MGAEKKEVEKRNEELTARAEALSEEVRKLSEQQEEMAKGNTGLQAALGVAQEALEREKGGIKALQEQLQCGKMVARRRKVPDPRATWTRPSCPDGPTPQGILWLGLEAALSTPHPPLG